MIFIGFQWLDFHSFQVILTVFHILRFCCALLLHRVSWWFCVFRLQMAALSTHYQCCCTSLPLTYHNYFPLTAVSKPSVYLVPEILSFNIPLHLTSPSVLHCTAKRLAAFGVAMWVGLRIQLLRHSMQHPSRCSSSVLFSHRQRLDYISDQI